MADDLKVAIDMTKERIREYLKKVPASVNNGSYNDAVAYKELCKQANKLLASKSPKYSALQQVANQLAGYK